jgi:hypothetical protein
MKFILFFICAGPFAGSVSVASQLGSVSRIFYNSDISHYALRIMFLSLHIYVPNAILNINLLLQQIKTQFLKVVLIVIHAHRKYTLVVKDSTWKT